MTKERRPPPPVGAASHHYYPVVVHVEVESFWDRLERVVLGIVLLGLAFLVLVVVAFASAAVLFPSPDSPAEGTERLRGFEPDPKTLREIQEIERRNAGE